MGHETVARVTHIGDKVKDIKLGQLVVVPFQINCGICGACQRGITAECEAVPRLSAYGLSCLNGVEYGGGLADSMSVPYADAMLMPVPEHFSPVYLAAIADNLPDGFRTVAPYLALHPGAEVRVLGGSRNDSDADLYHNSRDEKFYAGRSDFKPIIDVEQWGVSLKLDYALTDSITLISITAYDDLDKLQQEDADVSELDLIVVELGVENVNEIGSFDSEELIAFEVGVKSTLLDGTAQLNFAAFLYDYSDAQIFNNAPIPGLGLPSNSIRNGDIDMQGFDLDLTWSPTIGLFLQIGVGYLDADFGFAQFPRGVPRTIGVDLKYSF